ncbi:MAG: hypothetical protein H7836_04770 [Magnetococcus sp. YQC-3]
MTIINLNTLDKSVKEKIPLSLRMAKSELVLEELPLPVQYIIKNNLVFSGDSIYTPDDFYDVKPTITLYNDCKLIQSKKEVVKEYLLNYFNTRKGAYPFDPEFGNTLHLHLQTKDTSLRETLVSNELTSIVDLINRSFNFNVNVVSASAYPRDIGGAVEYYLDLTVEVEDEVIRLQV